MKILVVDDIEPNVYQLQVLLGASGYTVETAANGAVALEKARQSPPALIITDILMPVMDGFSLCHEWLLDERLRSIPLIFYTATYTDERDRQFALELGAARFIVKPEDPDQLLQTIQAVLAEPAPGRPVAGPGRRPRRSTCSGTARRSSASSRTRCRSWNRPTARWKPTLPRAGGPRRPCARNRSC